MLLILFLDKGIPEDETQRIFGQVATFLSDFARETQTIIIATYPPHADITRNSLHHTLAIRRANVVLSLRKTSYAKQFVLEKHPYLSHCVAELPFEDSTLADFEEANA